MKKFVLFLLAFCIISFNSVSAKSWQFNIDLPSKDIIKKWVKQEPVKREIQYFEVYKYNYDLEKTPAADWYVFRPATGEWYENIVSTTKEARENAITYTVFVIGKLYYNVCQVYTINITKLSFSRVENNVDQEDCTSEKVEENSEDYGIFGNINAVYDNNDFSCTKTFEIYQVRSQLISKQSRKSCPVLHKHVKDTNLIASKKEDMEYGSLDRYIPSSEEDFQKDLGIDLKKYLIEHK
jgi:hypothetical protein